MPISKLSFSVSRILGGLKPKNEILSNFRLLIGKMQTCTKKEFARRFARRCSTLLDVCSMFARRLLDVFALKFSRILFFCRLRPQKWRNRKKNQNLQKKRPKTGLYLFFGRIWDHFVSSFFAFKRFSAKIHGIYWTCLPRFLNFCIV